MLESSGSGTLSPPFALSTCTHLTLVPRDRLDIKVFLYLVVGPKLGFLKKQDGKPSRARDLELDREMGGVFLFIYFLLCNPQIRDLKVSACPHP